MTFTRVGILEIENIYDPYLIPSSVSIKYRVNLSKYSLTCLMLVCLILECLKLIFYFVICKLFFFFSFSLEIIFKFKLKKKKKRRKGQIFEYKLGEINGKREKKHGVGKWEWREEGNVCEWWEDIFSVLECWLTSPCFDRISSSEMHAILGPCKERTWFQYAHY